MKRVIFAFLSLALCSSIQAEKKDTLRFVYVLQNPNYYGIDSARSWFELEGTDDKTVQYAINDSLKSSFFELTNLEDGTQNATSRRDKETPEGYTDYFFWNGQTYGNGWVRFKDSDSLLRLTSADGYYGSGARIGGFSQEILEGKLAWIEIHTTRFSNDGMEYDRSIDLAFDLRTGKKLPAEFPVRIDPAKRPELEQILLSKAEQLHNDNDGFRDQKITGSDRLSDTVMVSMAQLIRWKRGEKDQYATTICRYFEADGILTSTNQPYHWKPQACVTFDEAIPFFLKEDWSKLQGL